MESGQWYQGVLEDRNDGDIRIKRSVKMEKTRIGCRMLSNSKCVICCDPIRIKHQEEAVVGFQGVIYGIMTVSVCSSVCTIQYECYLQAKSISRFQIMDNPQSKSG